jgi:hypothetical protein
MVFAVCRSCDIGFLKTEIETVVTVYIEEVEGFYVIQVRSDLDKSLLL